MTVNPVNQNIFFLSGGGEMGELTRAKDWSQTPVGPVDQWPQSLKTTLGIILHSKFPMFLWWGSDLICFYNDAYRPSLGENGKHPEILGMRAEDAWPEIWSIIKPLIDQVFKDGEATWSEDQLVPIYRNGKIEDVYWTFSYSPVIDEENQVGGVLVTCTETTSKINTLHQLEQSKNQLEFALEATELGTFKYNPATEKLAGNQKLKEWFSIPGDGINIEDFVNVVAEKDRARVKKAFEQALEFSDGDHFDLDYTIILPITKEEIVLRAKSKIILDGNSQPSINGTLQDITKETTARKKLEASEAKFRSLIEQAPVATCLFLGREMIIEIANAPMLAFWGKGNSVMGKPLADAVPELKGQPFLQLLDDVFTTGKIYEAKQARAELIVGGKPGIYYFDFVYKPLLNEQGEVYAIMEMATDVTEQVLAINKMEESEKRFRNVVEQAPLGITILRGADFFVEMANEYYLQLVDRKENDFVGRSLFDALPEVKEAVEPLLSNVLATNIPYFGNEFPITINRYGKKEIAYFNFVYHPLREYDGTTSSIIVVANDVTDTVKAKYSLAESEKQFRDMVMQSPIPMTILRGKDYVIDIANDQMMNNIWQRKPAEVLGKKLLDIFPELNEQKYGDLLEKVYTTGEVHRESEAFGYINGSGGIKKFYLDYEYAPLREIDTSISGLIVTINDVTEKVHARKQVEESEQRIRNFVENAPFPIGVYTGREMNIELANQSIMDVWGKGNDVVGKLYADVLPELAGTGIYEQLDKVYTTGISFHAKNQRVDINVNGILGQYYFNYSFTPLRDVSGNVYGVMNTAAEVTDMMMANQKLAESRERLNIVIEASELGTWEWTLEKDEVIYSEKFVKIFGVPANRIATHDEMIEKFHPDDLNIRKSAIKKALETGTLHYMARIFKDDGNIRWIEARGKVFYNDNKAPYKLIGTIEDITDQKSYQQDLEEREQKFRLLADSMPQFVWTADVKGNINYFNQSVYNYSGLTAPQLFNEGWQELIHPGDREKSINDWMNAVSTGTDFLNEQRFRRSDGIYRWRLTRAIPQRDAQGVIQMWVGTSNDIHDQKEFVNELEKQVQERTSELKQKNIDLEKINKELQSFAYISSHDLQEPLRKIQTFASFIIEKEYQTLSEKARDYFSRMQNSARRMQMLINDLLTYSKAQTAERTYEQVLLQDIIEEVLHELKEDLEQKSVDIEVNANCKLNVVTFQFRQLFFNLVSNSIKFSNSSTPAIIRITCEMGPGEIFKQDKLEKSVTYCHIQHSDNGIGFDPLYGGKIFELFQRLHAKADYQGTGIGLSIVKKIVENHNGIIIATGKVNEGATFDIYIPVV